MLDLSSVLTANRYPGRCVGVARVDAGDTLAFYAITGRSASSRERRLELLDSGELAVTSVSAAEHDPLRHYVAATSTEHHVIVGNGEQVAVVASRTASGSTPTEALGDLSYEPDPPYFTPRITAVFDRAEGGRVVLGSARRSSVGRETPDIVTVCVGKLERGDVVLLTTYASDGTEVRSGAPYIEARSGAANAEELLAEVWSGLSADYRVAAAVFNPRTGPRGPLILHA
jgi:IMP cyclohydrolase